MAPAEFTKLYDTTKSWVVNQFMTGYVVNILTGAGAGQTRPIVSNTNNVLTVSAPWSPLPNATSTYVIREAVVSDKLFDTTVPGWVTGPALNGSTVFITAGTGAGQSRTITANTATRLTVNSAWGTQPDGTSQYEIVAAGEFTKLYDTTRSWTPGQFAGFTVTIIGGAGAGQVRPVTGNGATDLTVSGAWMTLPNSTSTYEIRETVINDKLYDTTVPAWSGVVSGLTLVLTGGTGAGQIRTISDEHGDEADGVGGVDDAAGRDDAVCGPRQHRAEPSLRHDQELGRGRVHGL